MAVRRLHHQQPASFAFTPENLEWARTVIARFPEGRQASAVIPLMWRAQEQEGWVSEPCIRVIAEMLEMPNIRVLEVATFYTMFQLAPVGKKAHIQVCGTTPCQLRGAEDLIEICKRRIHHDPFHVSADGDFSWEEVECLGACVNAPMVQVVKDTYEDLTPESFEALIDGFARGAPPVPGPQNGRSFSMPEGGATTLTDLEAILRGPANRDTGPAHGDDQAPLEMGRPHETRPEQQVSDSPGARAAEGKTPLKSEEVAAAAPKIAETAPEPAEASGASDGKDGADKAPAGTAPAGTKS
ncbi:NADH-quinone oxidoreductase subunit NuoE [Pseudoxanthobacter sp. M-2]